MSIRPKLLLIVTLGIIPLAALSIFSYFNGVKVVESQLRSELEQRTRGVVRSLELQLQEREKALVKLAQSPAVRAYLSSEVRANSPESLPQDLKWQIENALEDDRNKFVSIACLDVEKQPLFRAEFLGGEFLEREVHSLASGTLFQTRDFLRENFEADDRVWTTSESSPLRSALKGKSYGAALRYTIPVFVGQEAPDARRGALVVDLRLDALLAQAADVADSWSTPTPLPRRLALMLDSAGNVLYHTNRALKYQPVSVAMPTSFASLSNAMKDGQRGIGNYDSSDGNRWLAVYQPIKPLNLSVAVAGDQTAAISGLRWMGWLSTLLTVLIGLIVAGILMSTLKRTTRSIQRVTEGAVAIAAGNLDEHIEVRSSDETRLLAETFNAMTDRLREQIAREAESRQFESFVRLSAILTHDLKNSILALSLLVSNMEQQFDNAEFRADAMTSLTEATDKLRALVAKLSEPVRSLSGEFKRPQPVDLVPVIKRVTARLAEPPALIHEVEVHLASTVVAVADEERIEKVVENLMLNAIEAMDTKKGTLTIEAGPAEEGFVYFSVADTGPGMTEAFQRTSLFRPFATTKTQGVGLGLYTCRELIKALGGRIEVASERGSGTCFRVVLPSPRIPKSA